MLEVKRSNIENSGLGVFATENIKADTILTKYDGIFMPNEEFQNFNFKENSNLNPLAILQHDHLTTIGYKGFKDNKNCGQMINDYSLIRNIRYPSQNRLIEAINSYQEHSTQKSNVSPVTLNNHHCMISYKDINAGEELYYHYGCIYWLIHIRGRNKDLSTFINSYISDYRLYNEILSFKFNKNSK